MAQSFINNGESGLSVRNKLNDRWQVLAHAQVGVSCGADTTEDVLATISVPANAMGPNGLLRVTTIWGYTNSGNNKTLRVRLGGAAGTIYGSTIVTTTAGYVDQRIIGNRNATNSQVGGIGAGTGGWASSTVAPVTSAIDTTADTTVVISGQKASSGETLTLEAYIVELLNAS